MEIATIVFMLSMGIAYLVRGILAYRSNDVADAQNFLIKSDVWLVGSILLSNLN